MSETTGAPLVKNKSLAVAQAAYNTSMPHIRDSLDKAAGEVAMFLTDQDKQFGEAQQVMLQPDSRGQSGDTRDIVITLKNGELGISAKNNHEAVKHSRLSDRIDFGKEWAGHPVSPHYFANVRPIFHHLRDLRGRDKLFRDLQNKETDIYLPVLTAFEKELTRLCVEFGEPFISNVFSYLLGSHDFYKVIKSERDRNVSILSMNMRGDLGWGHKWKIPNAIDIIKRKPKSNSTLLVFFTGGWQLSFRIHNASSKVEPSLKFDIQFIGLPPSVARHEIPLV